MTKSAQTDIRSLLDRVLRIGSADDWKDDISPTQRSVLSYLAQANRFSRAPSQVTDFLGATRGTVSQTLKILARKGLISEQKSETDKRMLSYEITGAGRDALNRNASIEAALDDLSDDAAARLEDILRRIITHILDDQGGRAFGICRTCVHHQTRAGRPYCALLDEFLKPREATQICHEHMDAS